MARYIDKDHWEEEILIPNTNTPILGGQPVWEGDRLVDGFANIPPAILADRTRHLKNKIDNIEADIDADFSSFIRKQDNLSDLEDIQQAKYNLGLNLVDNTRDLDKPVSVPQQEALDTKVDKEEGMGLSEESFTTVEKNKLAAIEEGAQVNTVTSVAGRIGDVVLNKSDVGLGNVDNTSDLNKPISTATQTALNGKVDLTDPRLTNSREWTASTVSQVEAEEGVATTRRAWTAQRVRQAIAAFAAPLTRSVSTGAGLQGGGNLTQDREISVVFGNTSDTVTQGNDPRLSDSREWTATIVSQAEAEAGTSTTARKWTAQRVRQAISAFAAPLTRNINTGTGLTGGGNLTADRTLSVNFGNAAGTVTEGNDSRLSDSREWTASLVSQAEAEAGTATTARKWTAQRVRQAVVAWWNSTGFQSTIEGKANSSVTLTAGNGLTGGGDLSANRSFVLGTPSTITGSTTNSVTATSHTHAISVAVGDVSGLTTALNNKVDKVAGMGLSQENFTTAEKDKLALLEEPHFKGLFPSLSALQAAVPNPVPGDYAQVASSTPGQPSDTYVWDEPLSQWVEQVPEVSAAQVKSLYESNPDTNAFTDSEKSKLAGIATQATKNQTDAYLLNRANHTGTQPVSTITGLGTAATSNVTTSNTDTTPGRVLKVGDFGIGGGVHVRDPDTNTAAGIYSIGSAQKEVPGGTIPGWATYINLSRSAHGEQLFVRNDTLQFRSRGSGGVSDPWGTLHTVWHTGNFDPSTKLGISDNAASATQLATARTINGTSFNGTASIATSYWGTARNITIGSTTKSVNGSGNVSWSLAEIGSGVIDFSTNPLYYPTGAGFDLNDLPAGARCLIAQSPNNSNVPLGDTFWYVECVNSYNGSTRIQRAYTYSLVSRPKFALRQFQNSAWTDWQVFDMGALDASNITTGTIPDARLPTTQSGKTFTSPIQVTGTFDVNGSGPGQQQNGLYIADLGGVKGTTNNPIYTTALAWQTSSNRSNAISVDGDGRLWAFRSHSIAGTYTFRSRVEEADKLTSSRTINGTSFDGSANITTSYWGTARNITIGNSTKSVNGSGNVSWSVGEIGAVADGSVVTFGSSNTFRFTTSSGKNYIQSGNGSGSGGWNNIVFTPYSSATSYLEITNSGIISPSLTTTTSNGVRLKTSTANTGYGVIHRNDGNDYYILLTNLNDADGGFNSIRPFRINLATGIASINGNAGTATALETTRLINGTSFNGTSNITTSSWGTARNITIGNTTKSVNGGSNVSWSLAEIGAGTSNLTIGTTAGTAKEGNWLPTSALKSKVMQGTETISYITPSTYSSVISWKDLGTYSSGMISIDLLVSLNFSMNVSGTVTIGDVQNAMAGKCGDIVITMTSAGTVSWGTNWKFLGAVPDIGNSGDVWVISYKVLNSSFVIASANKVAS